VQAWVNGHLLTDADDAAVPVTDRGFTVGAGVFETMKVVDSVPFALTRHLARLADGAERLALPPLDPHDVRRGVAAVLAAAPLLLGRLRVTWTGTTLAVTAQPFTAYPSTTSVVTSPWPRNERSPLAGIKCTAFADNTVSTAHAAAAGAGEALLANLAGNVCEGAGTNIFYVLDGELRTPPLASGCLPGVTRALVLEWHGAREVDAPMAVLAEASEVFLTSSTRDVQPVHAIDGRSLPAPGPVTEAVRRVWAEQVRNGVDP
jgi:branched-chain amino acid aminotransferase